MEKLTLPKAIATVSGGILGSTFKYICILFILKWTGLLSYFLGVAS
jgi:hypothetical protein